MPTLVLIPGLICTERVWQNQITAFQADYEILIADTFSDDSIEDMADRLLKAAPDSFAMVGFSMGGYVALSVMAAAPGRVSHLGLIGTNARADAPEEQDRRRKFIRAVEKGRFLGASDAMLPELIHPDRVNDGALLETIREMTEEAGGDAYVRQQRAILGRRDRRGLLPKISCPSHIICGDHDRRSPPDWSKEMASAIPGAALSVIPDCGHMAPLEQPNEVNEALAELLAR